MRIVPRWVLGASWRPGGHRLDPLIRWDDFGKQSRETEKEETTHPPEAFGYQRGPFRGSYNPTATNPFGAQSVIEPDFIARPGGAMVRIANASAESATEMLRQARNEYYERQRQKIGRWSGGKQKPLRYSDSDLVVKNDRIAAVKDWEYRYWAFEVDDNQYIGSNCRVCNYYDNGSIEDRQKHGHEDHCFEVLGLAQPILQKDGICVVCDNKATHTAWGFPVCGSRVCMERLKHNTTPLESVETAIRIVQRRRRESAQAWARQKAELAAKKEAEKANGPTGGEAVPI